MKTITGSKLYDYIQCPHRVWRDVYGPQEEKIQETNPFVELLWKKGVAHEERVVAKVGEYLDLREGKLQDRFVQTIEAMKKGAELIYQGVLVYGQLKGIPDLLRKMPDGSYVPIEIKSGMGVEGVDEDDEEEGKPKKTYAVQLCLYIELLNILGFSKSRRGFVIDSSGKEMEYLLDQPLGKRNKQTYWEFYEETKEKVKNLLDNQVQNKPALAGACKLCPWYNSCKKWCKDNKDLTNIFYLGRAKRDMINEDLYVSKVGEILQLDMAEILERKKKDKNFLKGVAEKTLSKIIARADLFEKGGGPVLYRKLNLPKVSHELFFDIEDDPTQEFVYLHGVYERSGKGERFLDFTAKNNSQESEKDAWHRFWEYIRSLPKDDFAVYYYSHHEKTTYFKMQKKYSDVISIEELTAFFANPNVIDLYKIVLSDTDWPLGSYSIKEIAQYLGFSWRDETPSGALSIQWFNRYLETKDKKDLQRILDYNEDDCKATMVLKDELERLDNLNT
ncbi:MAG TPA: TM0106 family RecB-like putative nuclease [Candidatus Moranbacteria bacterium]|jgi:uncharacterized protein|nr:TM0106 family RecB-like putative nuclease [Candidatus Moranbacteria bacterium]HQB59921.1 TM0106 family RecB-like putative nuclease [Candidatus Moranbacteria bacterium]